MKQRPLLLSTLFCLSLSAHAQWEVGSLGVTGDTVTFDATFSGLNNNAFSGTGYQATPAAGQLDSDGWIVTGMSDGNSTYGGTFTTGDHARGGSAGGVTTGGVYSFAVSSGDSALGIQPGGSDWTPGQIIMRVVNNTGYTTDSIYIGYDLYINNNEGRGNSFNLSYGINDTSNLIDITELNDTSVLTSQGSTLWVSYPKSAWIEASVDDGDTLYLAWYGNDATGSGSRDEFALDNIVVELYSDTNASSGGGLPYYPISVISTVDANGEADSLGVNCFTSGVVMGVDLDGNAGYSFTIWSVNQGGINVYSASDVDAYVVNEGDSVLLRGDVDQFNGLIQFVPDSIVLVSTANAIPTPTIVTSLDESTESELVRIENFWVESVAGANITMSDGNNTVVVRIDSDTDVDENVSFNIGDTVCYLIGIGGQFDNVSSDGYLSGYQLFPQRASDVDNSCGSVPPPPVPFYPIPQINNVNSNGEPDSLGVYFWTRGVVLGTDLDGNAGLSFTLWDMEGINIFNFVDVNNYVVTEGDSLMVRGSIDFYNGLTEIFVDSIHVINSNNPLPVPMFVAEPQEVHESNPIRIVNVMVVDTNQWPGSSSSGWNVDLVNCHGDTFVMRIDLDTDVEENFPSAPTGMFTVTGIGGQFDATSSDGYLSGYQIFPMSFLDIDTTGVFDAPSLIINEVMSNNTNTVQDEAGDYDGWVELRNTGSEEVSLAGLFFTDNPSDPTKYAVPFNAMETIAAGDYALIWCDNEPMEGPMHTNFALNTSGGHFAVLSYDACTLVDAMDYAALAADESYGYFPEDSAELVTFPAGQSTPGALNLLDTASGIGHAYQTLQALVVYPNPTSGAQDVRFNRSVSFVLYDILGNVVLTGNRTKTLPVNSLSKGTYLIKTTEGEVLRVIVR